jgi:hypothetical protein
MVSLRVLALVFATATSLSVPPSFGQETPTEPWGYLYVFRTMHLVPLTLEESRIGRLPENEVVLTSERVSRRHAALRRTGDRIELLDVGSSNGTLVNGRELRPRLPVELRPGDLLALADELVLYHESLPELWHDELRHRLLASIVKLRLALPQDRMRKSFGREELVLSETEARIGIESAKVEVEHSVPLDPDDGFPEESGAFIGHVGVSHGTLELSLWTIAGGQSMTSRRASFSNLKHTTLRLRIVENVSNGTEEGGTKGPWFPPNLVGAVFDVFPDNPDFVLQFMHSLAEQERPDALRDAAESLSYRHRLAPDEWKLLLLAARSKGLWVEREIGERGLSLTPDQGTGLDAALTEARAWLEQARELGAERDAADAAGATIDRASQRLSRLLESP